MILKQQPRFGFLLLVSTTHSENDTTFRRIINTHFNFHFISRQNSYEILPNLPTNVPKNVISILKINSKHAVGKRFGD